MVRRAICLAHVSGRHSPTATAAAAADIRWIQQCTRRCPGRCSRPLREPLLAGSAAHAPPPGIFCRWRCAQPATRDAALLLPQCLPGATPRSLGVIVSLSISGSSRASSSRGPDDACSDMSSPACQSLPSRSPLAVPPSRGRRRALSLGLRAVENHICSRGGRAGNAHAFFAAKYNFRVHH